MGTNAYKKEEQYHKGRLRFYFDSIGRTKISKVIEYAPLGIWSGLDAYNLGFGDYDKATNDIIDNTISNNGDNRTVFTTVLNSVPDFFTRFPKAVVFVRGSDSTKKFIEECKETCKRKCVEDECKKAGRRIAIYRGYVDENFDELSKTYQFWGVIKHTKTPEIYKVAKDYEVILVSKK